jgi:glutamine amidotransferase
MITIVDYGVGNIGSVLNMIRNVGGKAIVAENAADLLGAGKILLPGVGSFDNAMTRLAERGLVEPLKEKVRSGVPFLGICLGMQLLADSSEEGRMDGLGLIPGRVRLFRFEGATTKLKIPHMGWNRVTPVRSSALGQGLEESARFYFVHSYYFDCDCETDVLFSSVYGHGFASGIQRSNVMGVQFHPEKSHRYGMQLFQNFVGL